jgi:hypothetical protein
VQSEVSDLTQVTFMTPGVLLRKLASDTSLSSYTHIVIDEVHERDRNTDFLLIVLRDLLPSRPELRVILMSATLQSDKLALYFNACPVATIGSTVFPVQEFYLEDVLLQTDYVKPTTVKSDSLLRALCQAAKPVYTCAMCNRKGFKCVPPHTQATADAHTLPPPASPVSPPLYVDVLAPGRPRSTAPTWYCVMGGERARRAWTTVPWSCGCCGTCRTAGTQARSTMTGPTGSSRTSRCSRGPTSLARRRGRRRTRPSGTSRR